jgi:pimeloyl-ACP methyl ester carboxylesterase
MTPTIDALRVPEGRLHYELRGSGPLVVLVGAPMDARSFERLADLLATDHTVLTTDPRGINRSPVDDPSRDSTPEMRADDLHDLIEHVGAGPAGALGSSGGAVSLLALAQAHPESVHTIVAHEPPLLELLEDRDRLREQTEDIVATYLAGDVVGSWRKFLANANITMPEPVFQQVFGRERTPQEAADERFQNEHMLRPTCYWRPDIGRLRSVSTRIVVGIGEASAGELPDRASRALAAALGVEPAMFPGGHVGFVDHPEAFARCLREVLA